MNNLSTGIFAYLLSGILFNLWTNVYVYYSAV